MSPRALVWVMSVLAGCATAPEPRHEDVGPALPRSSIAAVLQATGELQLTAEQVDQLGGFDDQREQASAALRAEHEAKATPQSGERPSGGGGAAPGGRGRGRGGGGGLGGSGIPHRGAVAEEHHASALDDQLDDLDTRFYLQAEGALTEAQRPKAREVASRYRELLFARRHQN